MCIALKLLITCSQWLTDASPFISPATLRMVGLDHQLIINYQKENQFPHQGIVQNTSLYFYFQLTC